MKIHHIGYLVRSIEKAMIAFKYLGYTVEKESVYDTSRDIDICFLKNAGIRIELVESKSSQSVVAGLIKKYKNSPYHICYETNEIANKIEELVQNGYMLMQETAEASAIGNKKVAFFIHPDLGIIELVEI